MSEIKFHIEKPSHVRIRIINQFGRLVEDFDYRNLPEGEHAIPWEPPCGYPGEVYSYELEVDGKLSNEGMLIVK